jgi:hypothetical protein
VPPRMRRGRGAGRGAKPRGFGFAAVAFHPFFPLALGRVCFWGFISFFFVRMLMPLILCVN